METNDVHDGDWIAVQVRCGFEKTVSQGLQERGYEQFCPSYGQRTPAGRRPEVPRPLFPGYVFCRYIRSPRHRILMTPAVIRLVGTGNTLVSIPEVEIEAIRRVVSSGLYNEPWKSFQPGQAVIVNRGALHGVRGTLISVSRGMRLLVSIGLLGRAVAVEVDAEAVSPIGNFDGGNIYGHQND